MIDNQEHYHASDRFPSRDTLLWLNSLEKIHNIATDYTVSNGDDYILVNTTSANKIVTLPNAINGRKLVVSNFIGANNVTLTSIMNINNSASDFIVTPGITVTVKDIGGEWLVW